MRNSVANVKSVAKNTVIICSFYGISSIKLCDIYINITHRYIYMYIYKDTTLFFYCIVLNIFIL